MGATSFANVACRSPVARGCAAASIDGIISPTAIIANIELRALQQHRNVDLIVLIITLPIV